MDSAPCTPETRGRFSTGATGFCSETPVAVSGPGTPSCPGASHLAVGFDQRGAPLYTAFEYIRPWDPTGEWVHEE